MNHQKPDLARSLVDVSFLFRWDVGELCLCEDGHSIWKLSDSDAECKIEILRDDGYGIPPSG